MRALRALVLTSKYARRSLSFSPLPWTPQKPAHTHTAAHSNTTSAARAHQLLATIPHSRAQQTTLANTLHFTPLRPFSATAADTAAENEVPGAQSEQTGEGIAECELIAWFVTEREAVAEFDLLCKVQSDKASIEITSPYSGIVHQLHHGIGSIVKVGAPLLDFKVPVESAAEGATAQKDEASDKQPAAAEVSGPSASEGAADSSNRGGIIKATPAVRTLAKEMGIDLSLLSGTGPDGRIVENDLRAAAAGSPTPPSPSSEFLEQAPLASAAASHSSTTTVIPVRGYHRAMIRSMSAATAVPVFHLHDQVCMDALLTVRKNLQGSPAMKGAKLTLLPIMLKALSITLASSPDCALLNSSLVLPDNSSSAQGASIHVHADHNIGVAMATPKGLVVPNIKSVQSKSIPEIAHELIDLQAAASQANLHPRDLERGTITVSNIGSIGGLFANPLVSPPNVAIVALGRMHQQLALSSDNEWRPRSMLGISWGADHRVVDGACLASASNAWKRCLEEPAHLLLSLR